MTQSATVLITTTVRINGNASTSVLSANCAEKDVENTKRQLLTTLTASLSTQHPTKT